MASAERKAIMSTRSIIATALTAAALGSGMAACGTTQSTTHPAKAPAVATQTVKAQPAVTQTPAQAGYGFYNMTELAANLKAAVNAKLSKLGSSETATSVTCILTGSQAAECNGSLSNGTSESVSVSISQDGDTYITAGS